MKLKRWQHAIVFIWAALATVGVLQSGGAPSYVFGAVLGTVLGAYLVVGAATYVSRKAIGIVA